MHTHAAPLSLRERKKAETRQRIADTALILFLKSGYENVGVREIATASNVSIGTLFAYFPSKESIVFDEDADRGDMLTRIVTNRQPGTTVPQALRDWLLRNVSDPYPEGLKRFLKLVNDNPPLKDYEIKMWLRHEAGLYEAIKRESYPAHTAAACAVVAHTFLTTMLSLSQKKGDAHFVNETFDFIDSAWNK